MEISGKVKKIFEPQTRGTFTFREMVITTQEQYPQDVIIQFSQDKVELLNLYKVGDDLKISLNIRGREWINPEGEAKYFNTLVGWRVERLNQTQESTNMSNDIPQEIPQISASVNLNSNVEDDDLPF